MSVRSDAELALAWRAGDRTAFAEVYEKYSGSLFGVAMGLVRDRTAASDIVHDTFVRAAHRVDGLREPDRLRAWLFAILRNEATDWHRRQGRESVEDVEAMSETLAADLPEPHTGLSRSELADVVWTAAGALQQRDREVLELHVRAGLEAGDLADALGVTAGHAAVLLSRMRDRMEKAIGALLIARQGRRDCTGLDSLLTSWDGRFTLDVRSRVTRHVESCPVCTRGRMHLASYARLAPAVLPVFLVPDALRREVLNSFDLVSDQLAQGAGAAGRSGGGAGAGGHGAGGFGTGGSDGWSWRHDGFPEPRPAKPSALADGGGGPEDDDVAGPAGAGAAAAGIGLLATALDGRGVTQIIPPMPPGHAPMPPPPPPPGRGPGRGLVVIGLLLAVVLGLGVGTWKVLLAPSSSHTGPTSAAGTPVATGAPASTDPTQSATDATSSTSSTSTTSTSATSSTSTSPTSATSTTSTTTTATTTTTSVAAAHLVVGATGIAFGPGPSTKLTNRSLGLSNDGGQPLSWTASVAGTGVTVSPSSGTLAAGQKATLTLTFTRANLPEGPWTGTLTIAAATTGQTATVPLTGSVNNPPVISDSRFVQPLVLGTPVSAGATCNYQPQGSGSVAVVDDTTPTRSLVVGITWTGGSRPMTWDGRFYGSIGPFAKAGSYAATITATDQFGNSSTMPISVKVMACP